MESNTMREISPGLKIREMKRETGDSIKWIIHETFLHGSKREEGKWWKTGRTVSPIASFLCAGVQGFHRNLNRVWIWGDITLLPFLFKCHKCYTKNDVWFLFCIIRSATSKKTHSLKPIKLLILVKICI